MYDCMSVFTMLRVKYEMIAVRFSTVCRMSVNPQHEWWDLESSRCRFPLVDYAHGAGRLCVASEGTYLMRNYRHVHSCFCMWFRCLVSTKEKSPIIILFRRFLGFREDFTMTALSRRLQLSVQLPLSSKRSLLWAGEAIYVWLRLPDTALPCLKDIIVWGHRIDLNSIPFGLENR